MSKIHALVDAEGRPVTPRLTGGQIADWANIPPKATRKGSFSFSRWVYSKRNLLERFFNKIKQFRGIATRYDKRPENYLAAVKLVAVRIWCQGLGVDGLERPFKLRPRLPTIALRATPDFLCG